MAAVLFLGMIVFAIVWNIWGNEWAPGKNLIIIMFEMLLSVSDITLMQISYVWKEQMAR